MILSHRHRFIFIKTRKTAGTSVELALSRLCAPGDVLSPTTPEDEAKRRAEGILPRNYAAPAANWLVGDRFNLHKIYPRTGKVLGRWGLRRFRQHMTAREIKAAVPEAVWRDYTKITIERDPFDRIVSRYYWDVTMGRTTDLESFFARTRFDRNWDIYSVDGEIAADIVLNYETLHTDFSAIIERLKLPDPGPLPFAKAGARPDKRDWRDVLTSEQQARVAKEFREEIEVMARLREGRPLKPFSLPEAD